MLRARFEFGTPLTKSIFWRQNTQRLAVPSVIWIGHQTVSALFSVEMVVKSKYNIVNLSPCPKLAAALMLWLSCWHWFLCKSGNNFSFYICCRIFPPVVIYLQFLCIFKVSKTIMITMDHFCIALFFIRKLWSLLPVSSTLCANHWTSDTTLCLNLMYRRIFILLSVKCMLDLFMFP